jgi:hypothetical protein
MVVVLIIEVKKLILLLMTFVSCLLNISIVCLILALTFTLLLFQGFKVSQHAANNNLVLFGDGRVF